jgi:hypothetical protein
MAVYDIHFQPVSESDLHGFKTFTFGFQNALKVTGLQALVNRWVKTFMTPKGSDPLDPTVGTTFAEMIGANITRVTEELQDVTNLSIQDANDQVKKQDIEGLFSDDSRLMSATVIDYSQESAGIVLWVEIKNMAGTALTVRLVDLANR